LKYFRVQNIPAGDNEGSSVTDVLGAAERKLLRAVAHLLPDHWEQIAELIAEPAPPTPDQTVAAPSDPAAERLAAIDHIVVVMLENRSFDHMLGYLSLPEALGGRERTDVDGLRGPAVDFNSFDGRDFPIEHLEITAFAGEAEDPDHSGRSVEEQLADGGQGFVSNFARISAARAAALEVPPPCPGLVMGYYDADDLPVYDHLAESYCVVDRWFSSVPGATWPNRLYAAAGRAAGSHDDASPPLYGLPSFPRYLDEHEVDWRWYSYDPATLRAIDPGYRLAHHHRFAYFDARKLSLDERAVGAVTEEGPSFLDDVAAGKLPAVSWIDPHFKDLRVLGPSSNDDHPPSDVLAGQELVFSIYRALASAPTWSKTLLIVTYDEHGGFYDHVPPPSAVDEDARFQQLGVRVPALLVSPLVRPASTSTALLGPDFHFDHTSIAKTILARFCDRGGRIPELSKRVGAANHLGHLLSGEPPRAEVPGHADLVAHMASWQQQWISGRYTGAVAVGGPPRRLTGFQSGFYDVVRLLRRAGLPAGHP
jgi:phospholipase C